MFRPPLILTATCLAAVVLLPLAGAAQNSQSPCADPEAAHFDFWVGEWAVFSNGQEVGFNKISRIQNGCTLLEEYSTLLGGFEGKSFNFYDATDGFWHQVWVDNSGTRLHLKGGFADGQMVMSGPRRSAKGNLIDRITWRDNDDETVRQVWEVSNDEGQTWQLLFDGLYRHR